MTVAFTVSSNNFFAQARTMIESLHHHHPGMKTILFLVDKKNESVPYGQLKNTDIIFVDETIVPGYGTMIERYTVMELNTAVRPFLFNWIRKTYKNVNGYYIDPDMFIYNKLDVLDGLLNEYDIIVTPHFVEPIPVDNKKPFEDIALVYGVFNVGFLALNLAKENVHRFLDWWGVRTSQFGYNDTSRGFFADQIWFNLVPVFFDRVHILHRKGFNMAIWNLHERKVRSYNEDGTVDLESGEKLVIYHFSNWSYTKPDILSKGFDRFSFDDRADLVPLYKNYYAKLKANDNDTLRLIPCGLPVRKVKQRSQLKKALSPGVNLVKNIWGKI